MGCCKQSSTLVETILQLSDKISHTVPFNEQSLQNDQGVWFYTGLSSFRVLKAVFEFVAPPIEFVNRNPIKLTDFQEFMIVMAKLRLDSPLQKFAYKFDVSVVTVSRILIKWLAILDTKLKPLIKWPEREVLWISAPACYRSSFGKKVVVIIDCFEVFIERPSNLLGRASVLCRESTNHKITIIHSTHKDLCLNLIIVRIGVIKT